MFTLTNIKRPCSLVKETMQWSLAIKPYGLHQHRLTTLPLHCLFTSTAEQMFTTPLPSQVPVNSCCTHFRRHVAVLVFLHPQPPLCLIYPVNSSNRLEQCYVQINLPLPSSELPLFFRPFNGWSSSMLKWISIAHNSPNSSAWQSVHPVFFHRNGGRGWGGRVGCTLTTRLDGSNPQCPHAEVFLYWTPTGRYLRGSSQCTWVCSG